MKQIIQQAQPTTIPTGPVTYTTETIYYAIWEQEYGALASGPPYPSPTPYALIGTNYVFGQRVEVGPVHVLVSGRSGALQPNGTQR